jgi:L-ribulose-5-phosphate 3-epimerase
MNTSVIISNDNKNLQPKEIVDSVKKAGFNRVFMHWKDYEYDGDDWEFSPSCIKEMGLKIIFTHLPYRNINLIWGEKGNVDVLIERYFRDINECKKYGIPMVVMHLTTGFEVPMYNKTGIDRLKKIVEYAKKSGIKIAFENTKMRGYLDYVLANIKDNNVGICFDSGHYHAYFNDEFDFLKFKNKIFAVHLHDNDKSDDEHLIPFDGTINWTSLLKLLKKCNFDGDITLESIYRNKYLESTPLEFYKKNYNIANKLAKMYEELL